MTGFGSDSVAPANEWQGSSSSSSSSESQHYANSGFVRSLPPAAYQSPESSNAAVGVAHAAHSQVRVYIVVYTCMLIPHCRKVSPTRVVFSIDIYFFL
jgi:hypothetical protein